MIVIIKVVPLVRVMRLFSFIKGWASFLSVFFRILPAIGRVGIILFILVYTYTCCAVLLFVDKYVPEDFDPHFQS